jgi:hypothetical protein
MTLRFAALFIALGLAACSGGGSKATPPPVAASPQGAARGTMTLKVTYSALHHAASAKRSPQFVDGLGALLSITTQAQGGGGGSTGGAFAVAPGPDGSQTLSISAFATTFGVMNITESDANTNELAAGTALYSLSAGGTTTAAVTLDMAPAGLYFADSLTPLNIDAVIASNVVTGGVNFQALSGDTVTPALSCFNTFFIAATDAIGGFQNTAGSITGVSPTVSIASQSGGSTLTPGPFPGEFIRSSNFPETVQFLVSSLSSQGFGSYTVSVALPNCT